METFFKMLATVGSLWTDREGLLFLAGGHRVDLTASGHPGKTRLEGQGPSWQVGWMDWLQTNLSERGGVRGRENLTCPLLSGTGVG